VASFIMQQKIFRLRVCQNHDGAAGFLAKHQLSPNPHVACSF
jgi:hypothetical protein